MSSFIKKPHARGKLSSATGGKGKKGNNAVVFQKPSKILNAPVSNGSRRITSKAHAKR